MEKCFLRLRKKAASFCLTSLSIDTNKVPGNGNGNTNWGSKEHTFREEEWSDEEWGEI